MQTSYPEKLAVRNAEGEHLFWCDEDAARDLVKAGKVAIVRRAGRVRFLEAHSHQLTQFGVIDGGRGTALDKTRYSHHRDTDENPEGVWTLVHIPRAAQPIFRAVLDSCIAA
jgi:hypothetical protein